MTPPFGNAATSTNQQIFSKLSNQDISSSHTEGSSMHNTLTVENQKWRVKKKISRSALLQLSTESGNLKSTTHNKPEIFLKIVHSYKANLEKPKINLGEFSEMLFFFICKIFAS
jgi:hypothetical protein